MTASQNKTRIRGPQERAETTKRKILEVALREFSKRGFDAVTVRDIETFAGVQRNLVRYHFGSKDDLWKAAAAHNIERLHEFTEARNALMRDITSTRERISYTIRSFVRFCAEHPELNSLLIEEGTKDTWRIKWLVENHVKPAMRRIRDLVESELELTEEEFVNWYYLLVGGGAMIFSLAPEAKLLFGVNTTADNNIKRHSDMLTEMLLLKLPK